MDLQWILESFSIPNPSDHLDMTIRSHPFTAGILLGRLLGEQKPVLEQIPLGNHIG